MNVYSNTNIIGDGQTERLLFITRLEYSSEHQFHHAVVIRHCLLQSNFRSKCEITHRTEVDDAIYRDRMMTVYDSPFSQKAAHN